MRKEYIVLSVLAVFLLLTGCEQKPENKTPPKPVQNEVTNYHSNLKKAVDSARNIQIPERQIDESGNVK
ncbi:hypothetical protein Emin_0923 [Elusimicrobium minutum Pei191]|uniref:Lipoprotein n=1 Tax=Elusimicrobium minutum (strain Pei191) TaxID=445932 RepID=B2KD80_ELUMP|nr:hypothetical protein [Elusimicrobium minutum]ACC98476.1 hypothetical protein Emin_0923 [Elusimicrobium minutum Pei191]